MLEKYNHNPCGEIILGDDSFSDFLKGNKKVL